MDPHSHSGAFPIGGHNNGGSHRPTQIAVVDKQMKLYSRLRGLSEIEDFNKKVDEEFKDLIN